MYKRQVLDAIRVVAGSYQIRESDFNERKQNIEISITLNFTEEDLHMFHRAGIVSQYKRYDAWRRDFCTKLPSYEEMCIRDSINLVIAAERTYVIII